MPTKPNAGVESRSCPKCRSTNLQTEPIYDWEDGLTDEIALFCVTCGHYLGELSGTLHGQSQSLHNSLLSGLSNQPEGLDSDIHNFLLGRGAASPDFD